MPFLQRDDWTIEVSASTWSEILLFLQKCGWQPSVPPYFMLAKSFQVSDADAHSFAQAGHVVMEETLKNPLDAYSTITFDMGKFAEIVTFAEDGGFVIKDQA